MKILPTALKGVLICQDEPREDDRGSFTELFSVSSLLKADPFIWVPDVKQINSSISERAGTVRGMHWQEAPHSQIKVVRCLYGAVADFVVDIRPDSPTYGHSDGWRLDVDDGRSIYIPDGFAHGWQALKDGAGIMYVVMNSGWQPQAERGLSPLDPKVAIQWPLPPRAITTRDLNWPSFEK